MQGSITVLLASGTSETTETGLRPDSSEALKLMQKLVGGYIQLVPHFNNAEIDGKIVEVVAFCNEEGLLRGLPANALASRLWREAARRQTGKSHDQMLCGDVILLHGDREFMMAI